MEQLLKLVLTICFTLAVSFTHLNAKNLSAESGKNYSLSETYQNRLANLDLPFVVPMNAHLKRKIGQYVKYGGPGTEYMLGRAELYFPVFEYYLQKQGLPTSLKYLPIAESLLRTRVISSASAAGLWQLMPGTARAYGLRVDGVIDERMDVHRSTQAAVQLLEDYFEEFGDWNLVLAAYNCGNGRVRKAIRLAGSRNYLKVKPFLPRETRDYVSAYLAAAYAANFYGAHGLAPRFGKMTENELDYVRVYQELSFRKVAKATGLQYHYLRKLNPAYRRGYIPKNQKGYYLSIPQNARLAVHRLLTQWDNLVEINRPPFSPLAYQMAADLGFNPYNWLLGVRQENLLENNDLAYAEPTANLLVDQLFEREQGLAMAP
ncbi:MAG: lytic transglycosylase domain-containing protein [Bacteroidota bacterium]